jgi:hypothetical protein
MTNSLKIHCTNLNNLEQEQIKNITYTKIEVLAEQVRNLERLESLNQINLFNGLPDNQYNHNHNYNHNHIFSNQIAIQHHYMQQLYIQQDIIKKQLNEQYIALQKQLNEEQIPMYDCTLQKQLNEEQIPKQLNEETAIIKQLNEQHIVMQTQLNEQQKLIDKLVKELHNLVNSQQQVNEKKEEIDEIKEEIDVKLLVDILKNEELEAFSTFEKSKTQQIQQIQQSKKDIRKCFFNTSFEISKNNKKSCVNNIKEGFNKSYNKDDDYVLLETEKKNLFVIAINNNEELHDVFVNDWWTTKNIQDINEKIRTTIISALPSLIPKLKIIYPQGQKIVVCYIENQGLEDKYNFIRLYVSNVDNNADYVLDE